MSTPTNFAGLLYRNTMGWLDLFFFFFYLAPSIWSFTLTYPDGAHALSKEFPKSAPWLIQGTNPKFDCPKKQFALGGF